jgi:heme O synthase-like polyprenyltransferase
MIQFSPSPSLTANPFQQIVAPIINLLNMVIGPALLVVGAVGAIWCILLGVKFAKAEEQQDRDKAKGALKNAIIGFVLIFVLLVVLRVAMPALANWAAVSLPS